MTRLVRIMELLEAQKHALVAGDLPKLDQLHARLDTATRRLAETPVALEELEQITRAARRNSELLKAAQTGLDQARAAIQQSRGTALTTYDTQGRHTPTYPPIGRTLARR